MGTMTKVETFRCRGTLSEHLRKSKNQRCKIKAHTTHMSSIRHLDSETNFPIGHMCGDSFSIFYLSNAQVQKVVVL